jgi:diadenosine tetraphosphatase ApaH/serine/threonine PP2A family protein phosphatase
VPLALVSDVHGNDVALARVVAELERLGVERVVCLGDVAQGGPQLYVNPGSVGAAYDRHQPPDDFRYTAVAEYAVVTRAGVEFRRIPYDLEATLAAGRAGGWPHWALEQTRWRNAS